MDTRIPTLTEGDLSYSRYRGVERRRIHQEACFFYMENALTGVCVTRDKRILTCNQRFTDMFGFSREELSGMEITRLFRPHLQQQAADDLRAVDAAAGTSLVQEVTGVAKNGRTVFIRQTISPLSYEDELLSIRHVVDVTDQKFIEDTLRDSERELRLLSEQVLKAQEVERKRVASELHDGIGQTLSSIKFDLENTFCELSDDLPAKVVAKLAGTVSSIRGAMDEVRRISMDLRPPMLDDLGIEPTVEWLCREFQLAHPSIKIIKNIDLRQADLGSTVTVAIFRILQEAFNNVAKHANATRIQVSLRAGKSELALSIKDNGCGFIVDILREASTGFGLYSMRERATLSGGRLTLNSIAGAGTCIAVTWPCDGASGRTSGADYLDLLASTATPQN